MPKLYCKASNCRHNIADYCAREQIDIGAWFVSKDEKIECKNYSEGTKDYTSEFADDLIRSFKKDNNTVIDCKAMGCNHNCGSVCLAKEVLIEPCAAKECSTKCASFRGKENIG